VSAGAARVAISRSAAGSTAIRGDRRGSPPSPAQPAEARLPTAPAAAGRVGLRTGCTVELAELHAQLGAARAGVDVAFDVGDLRCRQDALQETGRRCLRQDRAWASCPKSAPCRETPADGRSR
jgi:hypothetical protein